MAADKLGKAKTIVTLIALPVLMLVPLINEPWHKAVNWVGVVFLFAGWILFGVATILTVISGFNYIWKNRHALKTEQEQSKSSENEKCECNCMNANENNDNAQSLNLNVIGVEVATLQEEEKTEAQEEAAITTPFDAASCLNTPIINSLAKIKVTHISPKYGASTGYTTPVEVTKFILSKTIIPATTSILSAIGSRNLPKSVTRLCFLAKCPSTKSVQDATINTIVIGI